MVAIQCAFVRSFPQLARGYIERSLHASTCNCVTIMSLFVWLNFKNTACFGVVQYNIGLLRA